MAGLSVAIGSSKGQGDSLWGLCSWTQPCGGLTGSAGGAPLTSKKQHSTGTQCKRCISGTLTRKEAGARECVTGDRSWERCRQENLWRQFFGDPSLWWDHRQNKKSHSSPDFRHKQSQQVLWLDNFYKPGWVDAQLAGLDLGMGRCGSERSLPDSPGRCRPAGDDRGVTPETVSKLCNEGDLAQAVEALDVLVQTGTCISRFVFYTLLKRCVLKKDLALGSRVHAFAVRKGYQVDTFLCNHILRMYAFHGRVKEAMEVFDGVVEPDAFMWSSMISAHVKHGEDRQAIELYHRMRRSSANPDGHVFVAALQACARGSDLKSGQQVHADLLASGVQPDLHVCNSLVNMYAKCGNLGNAQRVFDSLSQKNVVTWTAMIAGYSQQGMGQKALDLYSAMQDEGMAVPNCMTYVCLLQACASVGTLALEKGRQVHVQVREQGHEGDVFVANSLVNMYAKCGSLEDAQRVFDGLGQKDVVTWTAIIAGYSQRGMYLEALRLYSAMQEEGMALPNSVTFMSLLQACASVGILALEKGKELHVQIIGRGLEADVFVANSLVNMYAKCGSLEDARRVFDGLGQKDVVTWTAMIAGYSQQGMGQEALDLYGAMQEEGMAVPDSLTFACLLQACASVGITGLKTGKDLHDQITQAGHLADVFLRNSLVNMYAKCGSVEDAQRVLDGLGKKDVVTWTAMIAGYSQRGMGQEALCLYSAMQEEGMVVPDSVTFVCLLQACASVGAPALQMGKQLHAQVAEEGHQADVVMANSLVNMYVKCGSLEDAQRVFEGMASPNSVTFGCLLQGCASVGIPALEKGKHLHAQIRKRGYEADVFVANSLLNMFVKCGSLEDAQRVFDRLGQKDVAVWNAMIAGYSQQGMGKEALRLYAAMQEEGRVGPDSMTFVCLLQACASLGTLALEKGKQLHSEIRDRGYQTDAFIASSLVNMYAKCGSLQDAQRVFDRHGQKSVVAWNAMIAGYSHQGMGQEALHLYSAMQKEGMPIPDSVTFMCLLQACANAAALHLGRQLHSQIVEQGLQADLIVAGSLINMYGKCGSMIDAQQVFEALPERDVVVWNVLLAGYTCQGDSEVAFDLVRRMKEDGIQPDSITFLSILTVCSYAGLVNEGRKYFEAMSRYYGITPTENHCTCMVDLLGRAGQLDEALVFISTMPVLPSTAVWHTLLGACRKWSNVEVGRHAFNEALKLDKQDGAAYLLMSNIYISAQMWTRAEKMQSRRKRIRAWKNPGQSWWTDDDGLVHSFLVGEDKHPHSQARLQQSFSKMNEDGYVSCLESSPGEVSCTRKETCCEHSDELVIGNLLINTAKCTPQITVKGLRVRVDRHNCSSVL